jgi:RHS repeat-associated protein
LVRITNSREVGKFLHQDYLGLTKQLTSSNQTVTDTRQYDAFGLQTGATGSSPTPFGFAGGWGYQQDSTGLQLLGHRYYDPSTGRFLTRDPIKDGRNWYGYCENNPIIGVDPLGLWSLTEFLTATAAGFGNAFFESLPPVQIYNYCSLMNESGWSPVTASAKMRKGFVEFATLVGAGDERALGTLAGGALAAIATRKLFTTSLKASAGVRMYEHPAGMARSTYRNRHWKARADEPHAAAIYGKDNVERMKRGLAPQRANPKHPKGVESKELSHQGIPYSRGGTKYKERWPSEHAREDPMRRPGY